MAQSAKRSTTRILEACHSHFGPHGSFRRPQRRTVPQEQLVVAQDAVQKQLEAHRFQIAGFHSQDNYLYHSWIHIEAGVGRHILETVVETLT